MLDMILPKQTDSPLITLPPNRVVRLHNITCTYCGIPITKEASTKEHVIGKNFVPKGKLQGNWNLIINACMSCNNSKSDLEDDISAITMQPDVLGRYGHDDIYAVLEAQRKSKSFNRRTKKSVKDSIENLTVDIPLAQGATISFGFVGPAQSEEQRLFLLARLQLMAFFYWISYDKESNRGHFWPEDFIPIIAAPRSDWGNPIHIAFMNEVEHWHPRVLATTADGFFKIAIKKHPTAICWSWALEWNHSTRIVGFFGNLNTAESIILKFPEIKKHILSADQNHVVRSRTEVPITDEADKLFHRY